MQDLKRAPQGSASDEGTLEFEETAGSAQNAAVLQELLDEWNLGRTQVAEGRLPSTSVPHHISTSQSYFPQTLSPSQSAIVTNLVSPPDNASTDGISSMEFLFSPSLESENWLAMDGTEDTLAFPIVD